MSINKKILIAGFIGLAFGASSCKKYLNVNTNPNSAQSATCPTLLTAAELYVGSAMGVDMEINGSFFAQYWTQSPGASQYQALNKYYPGQDQFSYPWSNLYTGAENFYQLYILADSQKKASYMAISLLMQAYTFQLITDAWGDVPFTQALKGQYSDGHLVNPKYDSQRVVYNGIIALIDSANVLLAKGGVSPGADDLIYSGKMNKWQEFSNTLLLKVYLRLSEVDPATAQNGIAALYATSPAFIGSGATADDAFIPYGFNSANQNPLFAEEVGLQQYQNLVASSTCMDSMVSNNDPRINVFYEPVQNTTSFVSLPEGLYTGIPYTGYSYPSVYVAGDAQNIDATSAYNSGNAPVNFITASESWFLQAEAAARGWSGVTAGQDDSDFYKGIQANFSYYSKQFTDVTGSDGPTNYANYIAAGGTWTMYPATGTVQQKVQYIITQKWFAMCGNQGFEAWTEWRRTGYPNWFTYSVSSIIGTVFPKRYTYPTSESVVNGSFPGLVPLTTKVWWDAGTGDH